MVDIPPSRSRPLGIGPPADQFRIDARIVVFERKDAVIGPIGALLRDHEQWSVFVAADGQARKRRVKVGGRSASEASIEEGLAPGGRMVVYPSDSVSDGKRIKAVRGSPA